MPGTAVLVCGSPVRPARSRMWLMVVGGTASRQGLSSAGLCLDLDRIHTAKAGATSVIAISHKPEIWVFVMRRAKRTAAGPRGWGNPQPRDFPSSSSCLRMSVATG
ncbi:hypothetical protein BT67DRAFT_78251 [Trichocladium antarcticum]|uniref:Uncharacterized protein n=1 Tax=Trichocladium antarcticum TaxID=1450529 RepID=A0AAN6UGG3_9PEZI|nr:hypothetical protein BT67DRAFT_78251 [Trichocladium antarcticum]